MKKIFILIIAGLMSTLASAQNSDNAWAKSRWKTGITIGYTNNSYSINNSYQSDWQQSNRGGVSVGLTGQYNFVDWFGVRMDLQWMQKNYCNSRILQVNEYNYTNDYIQIPLMADFSFGGKKLRGFVNAGVYGGCWISSNVKGMGTNLFSGNIVEPISQGGMINSKRDNRMVFGYVGGAGLEYRFFEQWSCRLECSYYYDATSQVKQYQDIKDYRYNGTLVLQAGAAYHF